MAELSPELAFWLAILGILAPIFAASLTAVATHWFSVRREKRAKKMEIIGWLEWLRNYLGQVNDLPREQRLHKLPWWADHAMQNIGDSLHLLHKNARTNLLKLVNECWVDAPVKQYEVEGLGATASITKIDATYDKRKVQDMINDIEKLIGQIKDP